MKKKLLKIYALLIALIGGYSLIKGMQTKDIYEITTVIGILLIAILIELIFANDKKR